MPLLRSWKLFVQRLLQKWRAYGAEFADARCCRLLRCGREKLLHQALLGVGTPMSGSCPFAGVLADSGGNNRHAVSSAYSGRPSSQKNLYLRGF